MYFKILSAVALISFSVCAQFVDEAENAKVLLCGTGCSIMSDGCHTCYCSSPVDYTCELTGDLDSCLPEVDVCVAMNDIQYEVETAAEHIQKDGAKQLMKKLFKKLHDAETEDEDSSEDEDSIETLDEAVLDMGVSVAKQKFASRVARAAREYFSDQGTEDASIAEFETLLGLGKKQKKLKNKDKDPEDEIVQLANILLKEGKLKAKKVEKFSKKQFDDISVQMENLKLSEVQSPKHQFFVKKGKKHSSQEHRRNLRNEGPLFSQNERILQKDDALLGGIKSLYDSVLPEKDAMKGFQNFLAVCHPHQDFEVAPLSSALRSIVRKLPSYVLDPIISEKCEAHDI